MKSTTPVRLLVAAAIGFIYLWVTGNFWGRFAVYIPFNEFLLEVFARQGHSATYRVFISIHDVLLNLLLALPFAAAFRLIPALRHWIHVWVAAAVAVVVGYRTTELGGLIGHWGFWLGLSMTLFSLPAAFALLGRLKLGQLLRPGAQDAA